MLLLSLEALACLLPLSTYEKPPGGRGIGRSLEAKEGFHLVVIFCSFVRDVVCMMVGSHHKIGSDVEFYFFIQWEIERCDI